MFKGGIREAAKILMSFETQEREALLSLIKEKTQRCWN